MWDENGSEDNKAITHQIVDRPKVMGAINVSREYVQPQWVYDCINNLHLLPTELYAVGAKLPPHLSPFVDENAQGYTPEYRAKLDSIIKGAGKDFPKPEENIGQDVSDSEDYESEGEEVPAPVVPAKKNLKRKLAKQEQQEEEAEQKDTAQALLPKKKRRILQGIKNSQRVKSSEVSKLEEKRAALRSGAAVINSDCIIEYK